MQFSVLNDCLKHEDCFSSERNSNCEQKRWLNQVDSRLKSNRKKLFICFRWNISIVTPSQIRLRFQLKIQIDWSNYIQMFISPNHLKFKILTNSLQENKKHTRQVNRSDANLLQLKRKKWCEQRNGSKNPGTTSAQSGNENKRNTRRIRGQKERDSQQWLQQQLQRRLAQQR